MGGKPTFAKLVTNGQEVELAVFYRYPLSATILYTWQHVWPRLANTAERGAHARAEGIVREISDADDTDPTPLFVDSVASECRRSSLSAASVCRGGVARNHDGALVADPSDLPRPPVCRRAVTVR